MSSSPRVVREENLVRAPMGISGPRFSCHEVTRAFTTSVLFAAGINGSGCFLLCHCATAAFVVGGIRTHNRLIDVTRAFTTPQTFLQCFVISSRLSFSSSNRHTCSVIAATRDCLPRHKQKQIREELALTGLADSNRGPCGPTRQSNRKLHHSGRSTAGLVHSI